MRRFKSRSSASVSLSISITGYVTSTVLGGIHYIGEYAEGMSVNVHCHGNGPRRATCRCGLPADPPDAAEIKKPRCHQRGAYMSLMMMSCNQGTGMHA